MTHFSALFLFFIFGYVYAANCPNGAEIFARGLDGATKKLIVDLHNKYRLDIANGLVKGQPRGINLRKVQYDQPLADKAKPVSDQCLLNHIRAEDPRWSYVGQNIYMEWTAAKADPSRQNWDSALNAWFSEERDFAYPNTSVGGKETAHYRQLVFANTTNIGCDFIYFYDKTKRNAPYAKMYTCNYGTGVTSGPPYVTGTSGCESLC